MAARMTGGGFDRRRAGIACRVSGDLGVFARNLATGETAELNPDALASTVGVARRALPLEGLWHAMDAQVDLAGQDRPLPKATLDDDTADSVVRAHIRRTRLTLASHREVFDR